ncbi:MAG: alpha-L-fucosidase [Bacteroidota bacterium]
MKILFLIISVVLLSSFLFVSDDKVNNSEENLVLPSEAQQRYQEMEVIGFLHFNMNTFTDKEWGVGDEDPILFSPTNLSTDQWASVAKQAGLGELILTAKHHDGFCLWPSQFTDHCIKNSPYKNGKGDIVKEFVNSCRKQNLKVGLYLSPWDRNHKDYGTKEYLNYYRNQLTELLTNYGDVNELWLDGANGGSGFYGGAKDERKIDPATYYEWDKTIGIAKHLQPKIMIFSDAGPDIHWIGNENGYAGETFWSTINTNKLVIGASDTKYLNQGDSAGKQWVIGQCDVSVRPGWFYHQLEDTLVKTARELVDLYYKSVGRNALLLLNIPPDQHGCIGERDKRNLIEFRRILDETFQHNLVKDAMAITATKSVRNIEDILDADNATFWISEDKKNTAEIIVSLKGRKCFNRIMLQEPIRLGQRISSFVIYAKIKDEWKSISEGTTIGYKRLIRIPAVETNQVKIVINGLRAAPGISSFGLYKASERE